MHKNLCFLCVYVVSEWSVSDSRTACRTVVNKTINTTDLKQKHLDETSPPRYVRKYPQTLRLGLFGLDLSRVIWQLRGEHNQRITNA
jgi:hypothetical protein